MSSYLQRRASATPPPHASMLPSSARAKSGGGASSQLLVRLQACSARIRRRLKGRTPLKLTAKHACIAAVGIFLLLASTLWLLRRFSLSAAPLPLATPEQLASLSSARHSLVADSGSYDPRRGVAFALPVGGRTERSESLRNIVHTLLEGGAPLQQIFVFEDVLGRPGAQASAKLRETVDQINAEARQRANEVAAAVPPAATADGGTVPLPAPVGQLTLLSSSISRADGPETADNFGIHLARHYKYMLDYILVGDLPEQVAAREKEEGIRASGELLGIQLTAASEGASSVSAPVAKPPFEFLVIIEDDLTLAPDTAKFFQQLSRVMRIDESIYCVSAHQDNAFLATSSMHEGGGLCFGDDEPAHSLQAMEFTFRRGNHFMAPGWMTSSRIYQSIVRDSWLDSRGEYKRKGELHLKNGHWDRFFDSLIGERDCIFPELPRIVHEGAEGFTVSKKGQMELYSNLRLSSLPVSTEYGDLATLTKEGYRVAVQGFISQSILLPVPEYSNLYRHRSLVFLLPATSDKDPLWNSLLNEHFGLIGVGGYGGWEGYVKVRGIRDEALFVRWGTNLLLVVGEYSIYAGRVRERARDSPWGLVAPPLQAHGCFAFGAHPEQMRLDPIRHYTRATLSAEGCALSCAMLGFPYAGLTSGKGCGCTSRLPPSEGGGKKADSLCSEQCSGTHSMRDSWSSSPSLWTRSAPCGGQGFASVYSLRDNSPMSIAAASDSSPPPAPREDVPLELQTIPSYSAALSAPSDAIFLRAAPGQSCTEACVLRGQDSTGSTFRCVEPLFPLIHSSCAILRNLMGCTRCDQETQVERGFAAPGRVSPTSDTCMLSKGKFIQCSRKPHEEFVRACVCEKVPLMRGEDAHVHT